MSNLLIEAKQILAVNSKGEQAARDFMSIEQRNALAEDFAANKHYLTAAHFTTDADKKGEFEQLFRENLRLRNN